MDCLRGDSLLKTYDILIPANLERPAPPADEEFYPYAKAYLLADGLAAPPFDGVTFKVRRSNKK